MFNKMNRSTLALILIAGLILSCYGTMKTADSPAKIALNVDEAIIYGINQMDMLSRFENSLENANINVRRGSSSHRQFIDSMPSIESHIKSRNAEIVIKATTYLKSQYYLRFGSDKLLAFVKYLKDVNLNSTIMGAMCFSNIFKENICRVRNLKYRSSDGSCNNLKNPYWGKSNTAYRRTIFPAYKDGISEMNNQLPNPRELSNHLTKSQIFIDTEKTIAVGIWALFIGQDMAHTVVSTAGSTEKSIECCDDYGLLLLPRYMHPMCAPISIPKNDPFFDRLGRTCMNYVRSAPTLRTDCTFGHRDQTNEATHYLDASMIYGASLEKLSYLRKYEDGLMLTDTLSPDNITLLPLSINSTACPTANKCFLSGDFSVNSHSFLTALYTVWVKEHNRIARELALINPHWSDEMLYQETRRIIVAMIQHITFNEWLPAFLGDSNVKYTLLQYFDTTGSTDTYDDTIEGSTTNAFANVIVPMAYSMLSGNIALPANDHQTITFHKSYLHSNKTPYEILKTHFDALLRGFSSQKSEVVDLSFSKQYTDHLYEEYGYSMDILSLSIQRSRDHGIPGYTKFRVPCGLTPIRNKTDLANVMSKSMADKLMEVYKNVDDIDLIVGVLSENHTYDSMVGSTLMCIIKQQLIHSRLSDRYFYDLPNVFTKNQLAEIRNVTMSRVLCSNSNNIKQVQPNVFRSRDTEFHVADLVDCESESLPKINLHHWEEIVDSDFK